MAGLVLVDPYAPGQWRHADAVMPADVRAGARRAEAHAEAANAACLALAAKGQITRARNPECLDDLEPPDAVLQAEVDRQESSLEHYWRAARSEWANALPSDASLIARDERQTQGDGFAFKDLPLIVLGAGHEGVLNNPGAGAAAANVRRGEFQALAAMSTSGKYVVVPQSGHDIPDDAPDAVLAAVRDVVNAARATRRAR